ncbi:MAG TPA: hypothetical protein VJ816_05325, partial [Gemmatimonadales bacterium]|nr:hypothetical protein [Gemmatimonadales bacterium]
MTGLSWAIEPYHELLTDELAGESQQALDAELRRRGIVFGDRALCTVLRPRFVTPEQYRFLRQRLAILLRAFDRAHRAALADEQLRRQFGLTDWEAELIREDPGYPAPSPVSRFDTFYETDSNQFRLTEYNAETPAGAAYGDALAQAFLALPVMRQFLRRVDVRPLPARHGVLHGLLEAYECWRNGGGGGRGNRTPRIAILDWREVPTTSEFVLFQEYFRARG